MPGLRRDRVPRLSVGEMEIMDMLWRQGPLSLSAAHAALGRELGYTTVQTRLNRLADKGLVGRSEERPARYAARVARAEVSASHLDVLLQRITAGSMVPLVAHFVEQGTLPREEIRELKRLIAEAEKRADAEADQEAAP